MQLCRKDTPYRKWFDVLEKVLRPLGASYYNRTACHLDLVQWATDPTWSKLQGNYKERLIEADLSFLRRQLSSESLRLLLLNGNGVVNACRELLGYRLTETAVPGKPAWRLFVGTTAEGLKVIGWNKNLQGSFGVSNDDIVSLAVSIQGQLRGTKPR